MRGAEFNLAVLLLLVLLVLLLLLLLVGLLAVADLPHLLFLLRLLPAAAFILAFITLILLLLTIGFVVTFLLYIFLLGFSIFFLVLMKEVKTKLLDLSKVFLDQKKRTSTLAYQEGLPKACIARKNCHLGEEHTGRRYSIKYFWKELLKSISVMQTAKLLTLKRFFIFLHKS